MSLHVIISVIYAVGSFIIILIFTALLQNLFCTQPHRPAIKETRHRQPSIGDFPPAIESSQHRQTHSASFAANNNPIIPPNTTRDSSITITNSPTNASRTRSTSFSMSRRTSLPHAVSHLVNSMKSMLYQMEHRGYQFNEIQFVVRCAFILSCFGFLICVSIICIYFALESIMQKHPHGSHRHQDLRLIGVIFYMIGKYALYIGSSARLFYSLEGGVFQYNISVYIIIAIYFVIHLANTILAIVCLYIGSDLLFIRSAVMFYVMDVFYLVLLYTLFTKQLLKVIDNTAAYISSTLPARTTTISNTKSASDDPICLQIAPPIGSGSETSQTMDVKPKSSVDVTKVTKQKAYIGRHKTSGMEYVTKYSVLVACAAASSFVMSVMIGVLGAAFVQQFNEKMMIHVVWCVDCVINSFSIYLYFVFGNWIYKRLCGVCHNVTSKVCYKWRSREV